MVDTNEIKCNEPIYYVPYWGHPRKVEIIQIENNVVTVKPYSKKHVYAAYKIPLRFVFDTSKKAKRYGRSWESWRRKQKQTKQKRSRTYVNNSTNQATTNAAIGKSRKCSQSENS